MVGLSLGHAVDLLSTMIGEWLGFNINIASNPIIKGFLDSFSFGDVHYGVSVAPAVVEIGSYTFERGFRFSIQGIDVFDGLIDIPLVNLFLGHRKVRSLIVGFSKFKKSK